jgi:hypothetical protein
MASSKPMDRFWSLFNVPRPFRPALIAFAIFLLALLLALFGVLHAAIPYVLFLLALPVLLNSFMRAKPDHAPTPGDPTFSMAGGVWIGWWSASYPLARLSGDRSALSLSCFRRDYVFDRGNILSLSRFRFGGGLLIEHSVPTYPEFIVFFSPFWTRRKRFASLKDILEQLGYTVRG